MSGENSPYPSEQHREAALASDRALEKASLPYSDVRHYPHDAARQADLAAAEKSNIASAAGELGLTSDEWQQKRRELGHSPRPSDVQ